LSVRQKFVAKEGDHITLLNIFQSYKTSKENKVINFTGVIVIHIVPFSFGSRPSDHYFRSVCLSVCLFVCLCRVFLSRLRSDLDQTRTHVTCPGLVVSLEYRGCMTPGGWVTPKKLYFRGFGAAVNHHSIAAS